MPPRKQTPSDIQEAEQRKLHEKYRRVFSTPDGIEVKNDILNRCFAFATTFDANPIMAARNEGRRSVALEILEILNQATIEGYYEYMKWRIDRINKNNTLATYGIDDGSTG